VSGAPAVEVAVDNDVLLKAACYGLAPRFWAHTDGNPGAGVLGSARFVLTHVVTRGLRVRNKDSANRALEEFFAWAAVLEPTDAELNAAAEVEQLAQRAGLELDVGESQLAAIVAGRGIPLLDTGDKRAVRALEALIDHSQTCAPLRARVRCLEQLLLRALDETPDQLGAIAGAVCAEPEVDKTASICFGCYSGGAAHRDDARTGLESYVAALRRQAPRMLTD
jgi:hypothetical protein